MRKLMLWGVTVVVLAGLFFVNAFGSVLVSTAQGLKANLGAAITQYQTTHNQLAKKKKCNEVNECI